MDVWPNLTDVLRRIAAIAPGDTAALEALLPDRWVAAHPEHRLEQREEESREAQARRLRKWAVRRVAIGLEELRPLHRLTEACFHMVFGVL